MKTKIMKNKYPYSFEYFDSIQELVNTNKNRKSHFGQNSISKKVSENSKDFFGIDSIDKAYDLLKNGWQDATDKSIAEINKCICNGIGLKTEFKNDIVGFAPNVPLALLNVPNCMISAKRREVKTKVVNIIYDFCAPANIDSSELLEAGKNIVKLIIDLEKKGYRVSLDIARCNWNRYNKELYGLVCKIKDANQPINLKKLMYPIAHPSWFRVVTFDWQEKTPLTKDSEKSYKSSRGWSYYVAKTEYGLKDSDLMKMFDKNSHVITFDDARYGYEKLVENIIQKNK